MGLRVKRFGKTLLVYLEGELDVHTAAPFKEKITDELAAGVPPTNLVLLMDKVSFVDSSGVGAILGRYREIQAHGGRMAVVGLQLPVKKVFELSGMTKIISVHDSEGEALASL